MIVSHKYRFIFIKTGKTAGTSIEAYLSAHCGPHDIVTPVYPTLDGHNPRNYRGFFNPFADLVTTRGYSVRSILSGFFSGLRYWNHIPACLIERRLSREVWGSYFKFCVERDPWERTISYYKMLKKRSNKHLDLDEFIKNGKLWRNHLIYTDVNKKPLVDKILRYENLDHDLGGVFEPLGIPYDGHLGIHAKKSRTLGSEKILLSESQKDIVEKVFSTEISLMGYLRP